MDGDYIYLIAQGQVDVFRSATTGTCSEHTDTDDDELSETLPCRSQSTYVNLSAV